MASDDAVHSNAPAPEAGQIPKTAGRYDQLAAYRRPYLDRAYDCAELTLPALLPRMGHNSTSILPVPYQSVGARGVNNLASKLLMSLFPPNTPFFKEQMEEGVMTQIEQMHGEDSAQTKNIKTQYEKAFGKLERIIMSSIEMSGDRTVLFEALKHIIVTGNALLHSTKEGFRVFPINQYVVRRDPAGSILEVILKEEVDPIVLPDEIRAAINANPAYVNKNGVPLYTYVVRREDKWDTYQEVNDTVIASTRGTYPLDKSPWIALRFNRINGEDYGRGYVEEYIGDFTSLENLTAAIVQGSAAAAKILFLVKPNSSTKPKVLAQTMNGGFAVGNVEDVACLQLNKAQDFATAKALRDDFTQQLAYAFLLNTAIQREAERVTAEEIRYMAEELEQTLGGFYSIMSIELQLPYVKLKIAALEKRGLIPKMPTGTVKTVIVTGLEALGRGNDRNKLVRFLTTISQALGPQAVPQYLHLSEIIDRIGIADGIDTKGLVKTEEELAQEAQQAQMQAAVSTLGPNAVSAGLNAVGGAAKERIKIHEGGQGQAPPAQGAS